MPFPHFSSLVFGPGLLTETLENPFLKVGLHTYAARSRVHEAQHQFIHITLWKAAPHMDMTLSVLSPSEQTGGSLKRRRVKKVAKCFEQNEINKVKDELMLLLIKRPQKSTQGSPQQQKNKKKKEKLIHKTGVRDSRLSSFLLCFFWVFLSELV